MWREWAWGVPVSHPPVKDPTNMQAARRGAITAAKPMESRSTESLRESPVRT